MVVDLEVGVQMEDGHWSIGFAHGLAEPWRDIHPCGR